jgi:hypothetical protein
MAWEARWGLKRIELARVINNIKVEMAWEARWRVGKNVGVESGKGKQYL